MCGGEVSVYLADQILLPLAIAGTGRYLTLPLSRHSTTHVELVRQFLGIDVIVEQRDHDHCVVEISGGRG